MLVNGFNNLHTKVSRFARNDTWNAEQNEPALALDPRPNPPFQGEGMREGVALIVFVRGS